MKLFVWENNVLRDWGAGMITALAPDLETALWLAGNHPRGGEHWRADMGQVTPEVIDLGDVQLEPRLWGVAGGS